MAAGRILPVFVRRALAGEPLELAGEGTRGQDYVDVRDIAAAVEASLRVEPSGVLNIASGTCTTNLELAGRCVELLGSSSEVRLSGTPDREEGVRWEVSIERAAETIDYRPRHSLEDSITTVAEELRTNPDRGGIR
jgi:nucleoside-diphosphate-sugar epimerase